MNLDTEVWEGWTIRDLFEENLPIMDSLYQQGQSRKYSGSLYGGMYAEEMETISDVKEALKNYIEPASCAKPSIINELSKLFAKRYGITKR